MDIGFYSYLTGAISYLILSLLLFVSWRGRVQGGFLVSAAFFTSVWAFTLGLQTQFPVIPAAVVWTIETLHSVIWLFFLSKLLNNALTEKGLELGFFFKYQYRGIFILAGFSLIAAWGQPYLIWYFLPDYLASLQVFGHVLMAIFGLVVIEQLYRNTRPDQRWHIKFLCFGLGGIFAYDFYLFSDALLFRQITPELWAARGAVVALVTPLIALAAARNPSWAIDIAVSRVVVFHSATLLGAGCYLLIMAFAGYQIRLYGGEWGGVVQIVFFTGAFLLLILLLFSGQIRARLRVFLSKHFFSYSYDYRKEWLGIISRLVDVSDNLPLEERVIMALADLVEAPSGLVWMADSSGSLALRGEFGDPKIYVERIDGEDELVKFMSHQRWVVNLNEVERLPELYSGLKAPGWIQPYENAWLFVPLFQGEKLNGIVLLTQSRASIEWNWEAIDLLKTAGRQAASYLALEEAAKELAEVRQFEGFNRLSAFVIHDLKNLVAQLTLVVRNAEKHLENPEFMKDAIKTVDHAVGKMNRLMSQMRNASSATSRKKINLDRLLSEVIDARSKQAPMPEYTAHAENLSIEANRDKLASTLEHIIQNAQEAAGKKGEVIVTLQSGGNSAIVSVEDNGCGMDKHFIRERLFKPFDTTKGLTGMGIGAYESREYIRSLGGVINVQSQPNTGTVFECVIPLHPESSYA